MVPETSTFAVFLAASLVLALVPGPAVLYVVAQSVHQGRGAGLASALGVAAGGLVHVLAAAIGLSALLASSAAAFAVVRDLGAVYLVWLGARALLTRTERRAAIVARTRPRAALLLQGAVIQVLNPKVALFFLAFLPQFADPGRSGVSVQLAGLGACFVAIALCTDSLYALLAGTLRGSMRGGSLSNRLPRIAAGFTYIGLGVAAAFSGVDSK